MNNKRKYKNLLKNIGVLTISNFGSKLLSFLLVPLYTYILTTEEYGSYDFVTTTISLLIPILTLNLSEAAMRFLLEKNDKNIIISLTIKSFVISIIYIIILSFLNYYFGFFNIIKNNTMYFILFYITNTLYTILQNVTRGLDKIPEIAISGIINSTLIVVLNIIFLLIFHFGLSGYFWANILANLFASIYLLAKTKLYRYINLKNNNNKIKRKMTNYSKPLMLNSIAWWINNVSDRYIVTFICGIQANGIYSVAYKIPSILTILQNIFNQAWNISAVKEFDINDKNGFFTTTYSIYNFLMITGCSIILIFTKIIAKLLYLKDFSRAWVYSPFLMLSVVFGALSGWFGGIFSAVKNSKIIGSTTGIGAIINIILNIILINKVGVIGAAIATAISYFIVWIIRLYYAKKYINLKINLKIDCLSYLLLLVQILCIIFIKDNYLLYFIQLIVFTIIILINKSIITNILKRRI